MYKSLELQMSNITECHEYLLSIFLGEKKGKEKLSNAHASSPTLFNLLKSLQSIFKTKEKTNSVVL